MKLLFSILCIGFGVITYAQNTLSGKVTNINNEPLIGVEVYVSKLHKGTTTNLDGNYEFKKLPNGIINLVYTYLGFKSVVKTVEFNQNTVELHIILEESVFKIDEIIVSTPFNKLQSENVVKVAHKSITQFQQQGATTLMDGLSTIAGVSQVSTGVSIGKPVIRGLTGNRVLVYAQGVRLENQQFGDEHGLGLNDSGIESVEVIKGPASLLYGSDALGGVLYFNPEKFANQNTVESGFSQKYFSNTLGLNSSLYLKASKEKFRFLARLTHNSQADYKIPVGDRVTNTRFGEYDIKTGLAYSNEHFSSILRYNYNLLDLGINEGGVTAQSNYRKPIFPKQRVHNHILSLHNHIFFDNSSLDVDVGYLFNDRSEFEDSNNASLRMLLNTVNYTIKYNLPKLDKLEAFIGVQGMHQTNKNKAEEILIPNATINDIGVFSVANYQWKKNTIQGGLRYDNRNLNTQVYGKSGDANYKEALKKSFSSFNVSLGYKTDFKNHFTTRVNVATGFRSPNLAELTSNGVHEGTNRFEVGSSDLKSEQNFQLDIALEYKNEHVEFFANGFYNVIQQYIFLSPNGQFIDYKPVFKYNQDNTNLYGGEFGFHLHPHPLDWLHFESSFEAVIGKQQNNSYLPLIPAHKINNTLRTGFTIKNWLDKGYAALKVESVFAQHKISSFETLSKGYNLVHFNFGGDIKFNTIKFGINFSAKNIFNKAYISHLSRLKVDGVENIGRNLMVGVHFKF